MGTAHHTSLQMYPDNLEECLKYIVETAANFKEVAKDAGHPVTLDGIPHMSVRTSMSFHSFKKTCFSK